MNNTRGAIVGIVILVIVAAGYAITQRPAIVAESAAADNVILPTAAVTAAPTLEGTVQVAVATAAQSPSNTGPTPTVQAFFASDIQTFGPTDVPTEATNDPLRNWNPPPLEVPLAYNPFDHYWFARPVSSNYQNFGLSYYPYGTDGPLNDLRIHHGIDLANPIGVEVHAAGDGTVISADKGHFNEFESITAYGNVVVIDHDFGYQGQHIYTLYAHMSAILVTKGQHVNSGDVIGLIGNTGQVTGPHVHFEVRIGEDSYFSTRNPVLWMAPYTNSGVIAGRITFADGTATRDAVLTLISQDTGDVIQRTSSYSGSGVNSDDNWNENFVFPDVPVGAYIVTSRFDFTTWTGKVIVVPGATNWVTLERSISDVPPPTAPSAATP